MSLPWVVLKYGGTSVADRRRWQVVAARARGLLPRHRVWIVASAVSQVSNRLEQAIAAALADRDDGSSAWIRERHDALAADAGVDAGAVHELHDELERLLQGIRLTGEAPPRLRARVMSFGELASTRLGALILEAEGLPVRWSDARELLRSEERTPRPETDRFLEAHVPPRQDAELIERAAGDSPVVLTQGFIARNPRGETCLLGRGGSDTSAALFAALAGARRVEIWTDVHGMFTADPRQIPGARLIRSIGYREAQELAAMGAKVLHPGCLPPVARHGIPLTVRNTSAPDAEGTRIGPAEDDREPAVMAVVCRRGVTLLTISTLDMWGASGFLARAFAPFEQLGFSVDLVATSQSAISVTLDHLPEGPDGEPFRRLLERLGELGRVKLIRPCAVVSIVGRRIRTVLHELGPAMSVFREHDVHLVSESSEDLNLSFVVDEADADPLVENLHERLFPPQADEARPSRFGPSWEALQRADGKTAPAAGDGTTVWWRAERERLLAAADPLRPSYVYHLATVAERAATLRRALPAVGRFYYSMKANPHPRIVEALVEAGFGLECVSAAELRRAREAGGTAAPVLFTPNFCPSGEYAAAFDAGAEVTVDGPHILRQEPELFAGRAIGLRVDPGAGLGHHEKVRTAGAQAKFGHPLERLDEALEAAGGVGARLTGLHAHVGSGVRDPEAWARTAAALLAARERLGDLRWIDLGGGLAVVERPGQRPLDLAAMEQALERLRPLWDGLELRLEPGRFLVSDAGVLLATVTQVRHKGSVRFVGSTAGMHTLLRPALYGAWHGIHNLTRIDEPPVARWHVVGPICESSDVMGRDRLLPDTRPGDVLLFENAGAYGAVMGSDYNLRERAAELVLDAAGVSGVRSE